jgi:hypothetical protein
LANSALKVTEFLNEVNGNDYDVRKKGTAILVMSSPLCFLKERLCLISCCYIFQLKQLDDFDFINLLTYFSAVLGRTQIEFIKQSKYYFTVCSSSFRSIRLIFFQIVRSAVFKVRERLLNSLESVKGSKDLLIVLSVVASKLLEPSKAAADLKVALIRLLTIENFENITATNVQYSSLLAVASHNESLKQEFILTVLHLVANRQVSRPAEEYLLQ